VALIAIALAFGLAIFARSRRWNFFLAIIFAASLVPIEIALEGVIFPYVEMRQWWQYAVLVGFLYGLVAALAGYAVASFVVNRRNAR
jgi:hypothetical protein